MGDLRGENEGSERFDFEVQGRPGKRGDPTVHLQSTGSPLRGLEGARNDFFHRNTLLYSLAKDDFPIPVLK